MCRIDAKQIGGKVIRPAPTGTEAHKMPCLVYEDPSSEMCRFSVVTINDRILTAKTVRGLKGAARRAGLVWSERFYMP